MTGKVFISYRREGSSGDAGRLCDYLKEVFGPDSLFIDSDMPVGVKFKEHLHNQLNECGVFLAIIGRNWLNACDQYGHRRLDNADDWVRVEIASALDRGVKVVPVIIDDGVVPKPSDLPSDLKSLPEFQAFRVQNSQFERDSAALADKLREALGQTSAPTVNKERIIRDAMKSIEQKFRSLTMERRGFWWVVGTIFAIIFTILFAREVIRDQVPIVPKPSVSEEDVKSKKPSVLEEDVKSKDMPIERIEPPPSRPPPSRPPPSRPPTSRPPPSRPPPPRPPPL
jgi:TIR domain